MRRILVMGSSSGAGKSTFARLLGERLALPVHHLDVLFWRPGWQESPLDAFMAAQCDAAAGDAWIIEGNYTTTFEVRRARADTIIYLDMPLSRCLVRVFARRIRFRNTPRPDMAPGCPEKVDAGFLWYIVSTYHRRRRSMRRLLEAFASSGGRVIILCGDRAVRDFLDRLDAHGRS